MASESTTTPTPTSPTSLGPLGGGAGFLLAYLASTALRSPVAWYFPLEHRWSFEARPMAGLGMDFFGRLLLSLLCGAVAYALAHGVGQRLEGARRARAELVLLLWNVSLLVFTTGLYGSLLYGREVVPLPAPAPASAQPQADDGAH